MDTAQIIGQHSGVHKWTLGQRARLSGSSKPYFIAKKDVAKNIIYVVCFLWILSVIESKLGL